MGCQYCHKESQVVEIIEEPEIIPIRYPFKLENKTKKEVPDNLNFLIKAKNLIKILLSQDELYSETLNYILLFSNEQFEHVFQGDDEYKHYPSKIIPNKAIFQALLMKLEYFNPLLYEWYEDTEKYDLLIKLWNSKLYNNDLSTISDEKLEEIFEEGGISMSEEELIEFKNIIGNRSIASKASDIKNFLKIEEDYFVSLIQTINEYKEYFEESNIDDTKIISKNLGNVSKKLIEESLPLIKDYIKEKYPDLNESAKVQLETHMHKKLRDQLLEQIIKDKKVTEKKVDFNVLSTLTEVVNKVKQINKFANNPVLEGTINIASSLLNVATSIKAYYDEMYEYDEINKNFTERIDEIHKMFEMHKKELELLDLDDYEGSLKKLKAIGEKIKQDKKLCYMAIEDLANAEKKANEGKKEKIGGIASSGILLIFKIIAAIFTRGALPFFINYFTAGSDAAVCGINIARLVKLTKQLKKYQETKKKEIEFYDQISKVLNEDIAKKQDEIRKAFIKKLSPKLDDY